MDAQVALQNRQTMTKLLVIAMAMLGFGFAMVPLYRQICEELGLTASRTVAPANSQVDATREVRVELVASSAGLAWRFEAPGGNLRLHPGELATVRYRVVNTLDRDVTARAVMNTAPASASKWVLKQECFCFSDQKLAAGEAREMPLTFRVSPELPRDMDTISLSYTFFEVKAGA